MRTANAFCWKKQRNVGDAPNGLPPKTCGSSRLRWPSSLLGMRAPMTCHQRGPARRCARQQHVARHGVVPAKGHVDWEKRRFDAGLLPGLATFLDAIPVERFRIGSGFHVWRPSHLCWTATRCSLCSERVCGARMKSPTGLCLHAWRNCCSDCRSLTRRPNKSGRATSVPYKKSKRSRPAPSCPAPVREGATALCLKNMNDVTARALESEWRC